MATAFQIASAADHAFAEVEAYLDKTQRMSLLRLLTCGSVDDGKSTLLGRLLYDSKALLDDQLAALQAESRQSGTQGENLDFALLVDGLSAEREQGITIDVAYRYFATDRRKFIVADTPGHEQYTRNMVTGASTADLAIILIDARRGVLTQTRRHSCLVQLLGIRHVVLAVNKMDLVDYSEDRFAAIVDEYRAFAELIGIATFTAIPISALAGDNIATRSAAMPWHVGPPLLEHIETVPVASRAAQGAFHLAVQLVSRPDSGFRGYAGRIAGGAVRPGDAVRILPSGRPSTISRIVTLDGDLECAVSGQSVTLTLADDVDCSRGEVIAADSADLRVADRMAAKLVWMAAEPLDPGRSYWLKIGATTVSATIGRIDHIIDVDSGQATGARPMALNDIGHCELRLDRAIVASPYAHSRDLGSFILIDKLANTTVAAGMIDGFPDASVRATAGAETSRIFWLTDVPNDRRQEIAARAQGRLRSIGRMTFVLDEAAMRSGLSSDLGTGQEDAAERVRRVREVALLMARAGIDTLIAVEASSADAWPGRALNEQDVDELGADEWVI